MRQLGELVASEGRKAGESDNNLPVRRAKRQGSYLKEALGPLRELTPKHRLLIQYTLHGVEPGKAHLLDYITRATPSEDNPDATRPLSPGEPLRLEEAARVLGMRLRHARHLFTQQVFLKSYNQEVEAIRNGSKADAMREVVSIMRDPGDGSAAFRKVQLSAAQMILNDPDTQSGRAGVNVTVNTAIQLQPGIVVRLPPTASQPPLELQANTDDE